MARPRGLRPIPWSRKCSRIAKKRLSSSPSREPHTQVGRTRYLLDMSLGLRSSPLQPLSRRFVNMNGIESLVFLIFILPFCLRQSSSALSAFVMAMVMFPAVQRKAQAEIDQTTGGTRLPDFTDRASMVYLEATYREVLRWCQVTPLGTWDGLASNPRLDFFFFSAKGVPHMTTNNDVYEGFFIPKGEFYILGSVSLTHVFTDTIVLANIWYVALH